MTSPIPVNEADRLDFLAGLGIDFDHPIREVEALCALASELAEAPISLVSLIDEHEQRFAARRGLPDLRRTPRDLSFCAHAIAEGGQLVVPDAVRDRRFADNPLVTGAPGIRAYAGTVLEPERGMRVGTLCVIDTRPRTFSDAVLRQLRILGDAVSALLLAHRDTVSLAAVAGRERRKSRGLQHAAERDGLTGLLNRTTFVARAEAQLGREPDATLMILDADDFKRINDRHGHPVGDACLQAIARGLTAGVPQGSLTARLGGDEFAALLPGRHGIAGLRAVALSIGAEAAQVGDAGAGRVSIGAARYPDHGDGFETLYKRADIALYGAKSAGRNCVRVYDGALDPVERMQALKEEFGAALTEGRIVAHYQPIHDLRRGTIYGFETLARWDHPRRGLLGPSDFAPILSDPEIGPRLTRAMLSNAIRDRALWPEAAASDLRLTVNVTEHDLMDPEFAQGVDQVLRRAGQPWDRLVFEITEDAVLDRAGATAVRMLTQLRDRGAQIALDDFGTGHATLTHLRNWPIDILKVDRAFTAAIRVDPRDASIVASVVGLARDLGLAVVCEGIEDAGQAEIVRRMGCHLGQGYHFSRPMTADAAAALLHPLGPAAREGSPGIRASA